MYLTKPGGLRYRVKAFGTWKPPVVDGLQSAPSSGAMMKEVITGAQSLLSRKAIEAWLGSLDISVTGLNMPGVS
jgi:hypothetical protein